MSTAVLPERLPRFAVVKGHPTEEEVAALTAVLAIAQVATAPAEGRQGGPNHALTVRGPWRRLKVWRAPLEVRRVGPLLPGLRGPSVSSATTSRYARSSLG
jgi:hypothetical protein